MPKESPIFVRTYDFLKWIIPATTKFPREHRFVLAQKIQTAAFEFQDSLIDAGSSELETLSCLRRADSVLRRLRIYWRLTFDLDLCPIKRYEHGSRLMDELGRLLGGWLKVERNRVTL